MSGFVEFVKTAAEVPLRVLFAFLDQPAWRYRLLCRDVDNALKKVNFVWIPALEAHKLISYWPQRFDASLYAGRSIRSHHPPRRRPSGAQIPSEGRQPRQSSDERHFSDEGTSSEGRKLCEGGALPNERQASQTRCDSRSPIHHRCPTAYEFLMSSLLALRDWKRNRFRQSFLVAIPPAAQDLRFRACSFYSSTLDLAGTRIGMNAPLYRYNALDCLCVASQRLPAVDKMQSPDRARQLSADKDAELRSDVLLENIRASDDVDEFGQGQKDESPAIPNLNDFDGVELPVALEAKDMNGRRKLLAFWPGLSNVAVNLTASNTLAGLPPAHSAPIQSPDSLPPISWSPVVGRVKVIPALLSLPWTSVLMKFESEPILCCRISCHLIKPDPRDWNGLPTPIGTPAALFCVPLGPESSAARLTDTRGLERERIEKPEANSTREDHEREEKRSVAISPKSEALFEGSNGSKAESSILPPEPLARCNLSAYSTLYFTNPATPVDCLLMAIGSSSGHVSIAMGQVSQSGLPVVVTKSQIVAKDTLAVTKLTLSFIEPRSPIDSGLVSLWIEWGNRSWQLLRAPFVPHELEDLSWCKVLSAGFSSSLDSAASAGPTPLIAAGPAGVEQVETAPPTVCSVEAYWNAPRGQIALVGVPGQGVIFCQAPHALPKKVSRVEKVELGRFSVLRASEPEQGTEAPDITGQNPWLSPGIVARDASWCQEYRVSKLPTFVVAVPSLDLWVLAVSNCLRVITMQEAGLKINSVLIGHRERIYKGASDGISKFVSIDIAERLFIWDLRKFQKLTHIDLLAAPMNLITGQDLECRCANSTSHGDLSNLPASKSGSPAIEEEVPPLVRSEFPGLVGAACLVPESPALGSIAMRSNAADWSPTNSPHAKASDVPSTEASGATDLPESQQMALSPSDSRKEQQKTRWRKLGASLKEEVAREGSALFLSADGQPGFVREKELTLMEDVEALRIRLGLTIGEMEIYQHSLLEDFDLTNTIKQSKNEAVADPDAALLATEEVRGQQAELVSASSSRKKHECSKSKVQIITTLACVAHALPIETAYVMRDCGRRDENDRKELLGDRALQDCEDRRGTRRGIFHQLTKSVNCDDEGEGVSSILRRAGCKRAVQEVYFTEKQLGLFFPALGSWEFWCM